LGHVLSNKEVFIILARYVGYFEGFLLSPPSAESLTNGALLAMLVSKVWNM
jgi:hypothetical protein